MMDNESRRDPAPDFTQLQERVFARLQPTSEVEKRLAQRIARCRYTLEQTQNRLTETWGQLNKMQDFLRHDPLP